MLAGQVATDLDVTVHDSYPVQGRDCKQKLSEDLQRSVRVIQVEEGKSAKATGLLPPGKVICKSKKSRYADKPEREKISRRIAEAAHAHTTPDECCDSDLAR
jgi:hypothetical protein